MTAEAPIDRTLLHRRIHFLQSGLAKRDKPVPTKDAGESWDAYHERLERAFCEGSR